MNNTISSIYKFKCSVKYANICLNCSKFNNKTKLCNIICLHNIIKITKLPNNCNLCRYIEKCKQEYKK